MLVPGGPLHPKARSAALTTAVRMTRKAARWAMSK